ncbi:MAG: kelch repeat-containing protein [Gemmatimonadales bacterium]
MTRHDCQVRRLPLALVLGTIGLAACGESSVPMQHETPGEPGPATLALGAGAGTWVPKAATGYGEEFYGYSLGMAPNSAGQSIVYALGGSYPERGGAGSAVRAYNVATNTWTGGRLSRVGVFYSNGVGKIGSKLYYSGGYNEPGTLPTFVNTLWAYDYARDRLIRKTDMPIYGAEGVSGVINGKLYVLPGACSGDRYPEAGYCAVEETRRLYRYDPATNSWATLREAPHYHRRGAATVINGKFYVAGGLGVGKADLRDLDVYDPATNAWRTLAPLPTGGVATGSALQGQFYAVVQRFNGTSLETRAFTYNRNTNKWRAGAAPDFLGSMTRVDLNGSSTLFTASGSKSLLYMP